MRFSRKVTGDVPREIAALNLSREMFTMHMYQSNNNQVYETCVGSLDTETLPHLNTKLFYTVTHSETTPNSYACERSDFSKKKEVRRTDGLMVAVQHVKTKTQNTIKCTLRYVCPRESKLLYVDSSSHNEGPARALISS